ncbi:hypothetical protein HY041_04095 [Candidatus Roizmanbacteria bacterium]|nr:hypothetical protein [Candidatus Roizmanbacteria bacterium]
MNKFVTFFPSLVSGLFIIIVGFLLGGLIKKILLSLFSFIRLDSLFEKTKLIEKKEVKVWEEILTEVLRWTIVVLFLIPSFEVWGLSRATVVLNQFLFYLPNVIVAVIIAFVGLVTSNLGADLVKSSAKTVRSTSAIALSVFTKWLILFFTVLVVLNQLGVAQDLIRILFTGIVVMIALAGGLAFGLGGQTVAKEMLEELRNKFK